MDSFKEIEQRLVKLGKVERARVSSSFFKTGPGEYAEGDLFRGITIPNLRKLEKELRALFDFKLASQLLQSAFHEDRILAVIYLVNLYKASIEKSKVYDFYISHIKYINNWDLVDCSAEYIVGNELLKKDDYSALIAMAKDESIWVKRIAIVATFAFIRAGKLEPSLRISKMLLNEKEDLLHKAVGWVLRVVGKSDRELLDNFLIENYQNLPRTSLRYAIEKHSSAERKIFLKGDFK